VANLPLTTAVGALAFRRALGLRRRCGGSLATHGPAAAGIEHGHELDESAAAAAPSVNVLRIAAAPAPAASLAVMAAEGRRRMGAAATAGWARAADASTEAKLGRAQPTQTAVAAGPDALPFLAALNYCSFMGAVPDTAASPAVVFFAAVAAVADAAAALDVRLTREAPAALAASALGMAPASVKTGDVPPPLPAAARGRWVCPAPRGRFFVSRALCAAAQQRQAPAARERLGRQYCRTAAASR
jgi:hypothetical protein